MIPGTKGQKAFELGEDPLYAFENNIALDYDWYAPFFVRTFPLLTMGF
jgi:hypothetical protein